MKLNSLKIATRKSKLALWQANFVKDALEKKHPPLKIELVEIVTDGDRLQNVALTDVGGKSVFVKALQTALLNNTADIAVHSMKDMSVHDTADLTIAAVCERADARDAFLSINYADIASLPKNAVVGTASPRRSSLIKSLRPDVQIKLLRGNVDTRLAKLQQGDFDAIILAAAGLHRLSLSSHIRTYLDTDFFTPAIAQGAIAIECRENDEKTRELLHFLHHEPTKICVTAERAVNKVLNGDCHTAIGAYAKIIDDQLHLSAMLGQAHGEKILRASAIGEKNEPEKLGEIVARSMAV